MTTDRHFIPARIKQAILLLAVLLFTAQGMLMAQAPSRLMGTIMTLNKSSLSVKTDQGETRQIQLTATATFKRIAPGQTSLSAAETIQLSDLANGDRVLVRLNADGQAEQIIAIKQADVAQKQQKDREDWQLHSVGGLVKSTDAASGTIVLTSGMGAAAKTITVHTAAKTILKRYAPASVDYNLAKAAPITEIHTGDQIRARGEKNADGTEVTADEVVSGTFRNLSGTISAINSADSTFTIKDLQTKKTVTIHVSADAQMRKLPDQMARFLATQLKNTSSASGNNASPQHAGDAQGGPRRGGDMQQMLTRLPAIKLSDLNKEDAVMLVSTDGTTDVTVITLLAGVEPLLEAPAAQNLLSNWSMNSGGDAGAQ